MLSGWDWNPVMRIHVLSESSILKQFNALATTQLVLFIIFALVILVAISLFLVRWVSTPLKLISKSLKTGDPGHTEEAAPGKNRVRQSGAAHSHVLPSEGGADKGGERAHACRGSPHRNQPGPHGAY